MTEEASSEAEEAQESSNKRKLRNTVLIIAAVVLLIISVLLLFFDPRNFVFQRGDSWSLGNFALMDITVIESFMLLLGGFVTVTRKKNREKEEAEVNIKWVPRLLSVVVMVISIIFFIFVEDVDLLPLVYFDKWTWVFVVLVIIQTILVALSKKEYGDQKGSENTEPLKTSEQQEEKESESVS